VKKCIGKVIVCLSKSLNYTHFDSYNEIKTHFDRHFNYCYSSSYINKITGDRNIQNILAVVYLHWAFTFRCWLCRESLGLVVFYRYRFTLPNP